MMFFVVLMVVVVVPVVVGAIVERFTKPAAAATPKRPNADKVYVAIVASPDAAARSPARPVKERPPLADVKDTSRLAISPHPRGGTGTGGLSRSAIFECYAAADRVMPVTLYRGNDAIASIRFLRVTLV